MGTDAEKAWVPGFYKDTTNGDLWRLDTFADSDREVWTWINGGRWRFVPREHLVLWEIPRG